MSEQSLPDQILDAVPKIYEIKNFARTADWNNLGIQLQLNETSLAGCRECAAVYQLWLDEKGRHATRRMLLTALRDIRQNSVADNYVDHLKTIIKVPVSDSTEPKVMDHNATDVLKSAPDKFKVLDLLADISARWQTIGLALRVDGNTLSSTSSNPTYGSDAIKLDAVIEAWKNTRSSPYTWEMLISAIGGPIVNHQAKVDEIRTYLASLPN